MYAIVIRNCVSILKKQTKMDPWYFGCCHLYLLFVKSSMVQEIGNTQTLCCFNHLIFPLFFPIILCGKFFFHAIKFSREEKTQFSLYWLRFIFSETTGLLKIEFSVGCLTFLVHAQEVKTSSFYYIIKYIYIYIYYCYKKILKMIALSEKD